MGDKQVLTDEQTERDLKEEANKRYLALGEVLLDLAEFYARRSRLDEARQIGALSVACTLDLTARAWGFLALGLRMEEAERFDLAAEFYAKGLEIEPTEEELWYWLKNDLGYALNQLGRFTEAERACQAAIRSDSRPHNAYKNLGVALEGQGRYGEAANAYIAAVQAGPGDPRAFNLLVDLVAAHREAVAAAIPDYFMTCHGLLSLVQAAGGFDPGAESAD